MLSFSECRHPPCQSHPAAPHRPPCSAQNPSHGALNRIPPYHTTVSHSRCHRISSPPSMTTTSHPEIVNSVNHHHQEEASSRLCRAPLHCKVTATGRPFLEQPRKSVVCLSSHPSNLFFFFFKNITIKTLEATICYH